MSEPASRDFSRRDIAAVIAVTALSIVASIRFDLNESLFALTRRAEYFQVDELPIGLLVLLICLIWLAWRRYRQARRELGLRRSAEGRLEVLLAENRELTRENIRIQEAERKHLARELHDELGQYLNAIKLDAVSLTEHGAADVRNAASLSIIRAVDHVHWVIGEMIARLRPVGLDELGLVAAVEHCLDGWRQRVPNTQFELQVHGQFENLDEARSLTMYRLIQEGVTNIYKHAQATRARMILERREAAGELCLIVADDGCGMKPAALSVGFGLRGMRERVEGAGGVFTVDSEPGCGLRFEARLPDK